MLKSKKTALENINFGDSYHVDRKKQSNTIIENFVFYPMFVISTVTMLSLVFQTLNLSHFPILLLFGLLALTFMIMTSKN
jgi:hypothetical protein